LKDEDDIHEAIINLTLKVLRDTGSVGTVMQFCGTASNRLRDLRDSVLSSRGIEQWFATNGVEPVSASSTLEKAKSREGFLGVTGKFFTDDEIAQVMQDAKSELAVWTLRALGKVLNLSPDQGVKGSGLLDRVRARLEDVAARSEFLSQCSSVVRDRMNISVVGLEDEKKNLFATDNPARDIEEVADMHIERRIRPIFPAENELQLFADSAIEFAESVIRGQDTKSRKEYHYDAKAQPEPLDHEDWLAELESGFKASRYMATFPEGRRSVMEKFRLAKVLRDLTIQWRKLLQASWNKGNKDEYYEIAQRFRNFFGIDPTLVGDTVEISGGEEFRSVAGDDFLLLGLATASARTCRPFWRTTNKAEQKPKLIVQVPVSIEKATKEKWIKMIKELSNLPIQNTDQVELIANETAGSDKEHNPYILAVYTSTAADNLDEVTTLDAWRDPIVLQSLRLAEDTDGKCPMPFNDEIKKLWRQNHSNYRGSGFTDPSYIYQPELRRNRWRPWVSQEDQEKQATQDDGSKQGFVAVYACLGPKWYLTAALGEEQANALLAASGLPGEPILAEGTRKMFKLARLPYRIVAGKADKDVANIMIDPGNNVTQSIRTIPEVFTGKREARSGKGAGTDHIMELGKSVENEYNDFFGAFAEAQGFHATTAKAAHLKMLQKLKDHFLHERESSNSNQEDGDRAFWQSVLEAVNKQIQSLGR
jgi:hypothetical protein